MLLYVSVEQAIEVLRKQAGLSQRDLAGRLGWPFGSLSSYMHRLRNGRVPERAELDAFGRPPRPCEGSAIDRPNLSRFPRVDRRNARQVRAVGRRGRCRSGRHRRVGERAGPAGAIIAGMDRMSPLDAVFLHAEDAVQPMHIASVGVFEGPAPPYADVVHAISAKLALIPRYRQKVRFVPFELARPVWVDDPHFNVEYHVRHTALPPPGGDDDLRNLVARVMAQQLDRHKPLWEIWVAEGLEGGRWAFLSKVHHCMVDGISGSELMAVLFDVTREPAPLPEDTGWRPAPEPSEAALVADAVAGFLRSPMEQFRAARALVRKGPQPLRRVLRDTAKGARRFADVLLPAPKTSLNGPIGPHRRWDWARASLADVKQVAKASGGTVNDVVLATITRGFRDLLLSRGESVETAEVRTFVPVSVRSSGEHNEYNNKVSGMVATLPVEIYYPRYIIPAISAKTNGLKYSKESVAGEVLARLSGFASPMLLALGARTAYKVSQRTIQTVTTNVPGPQLPLYVCGRLMLEAFPYVPLGSTVRVTVGIFSYNGTVRYGVTGDWESVPDIRVLCGGIEAGIAELR